MRVVVSISFLLIAVIGSAFQGGTTEAFVTPQTPLRNMASSSKSVVVAAAAPKENMVEEPTSLPLVLDEQESTSSLSGTGLDNTAKMIVTAMSVWAATPLASLAAGPDWGIFEGRTGSILHPFMMASLLVYSLYTAFLGFQWRRQRTIGDDISDLKKRLPDLQGAKTVSEAIANAKEAGTDTGKLQAALSVEQEIASLQDERKSLSQAAPRDKHFAQGALLAFLGTIFAIEGPLNTYARAGKLFPGPHLYVGAGLVCMWALAYSCVPAMQKGNDTARYVHIGANVIGISFFVWQVTTGVPILLKVIELTKWP